MRAFWVVVFVVFSVLAGLGATATVYSLFSGDDDLPGNAVLLAGSLAFAGFGSAVELRRSWALLRLSPSAGWKNKQGWIGGWGKSMVVGLENGPYVLAVHAIRERISRSPR